MFEIEAKKYLYILMGSVLFCGCNTAPVGFRAPSGSTITLSPDATVEVASGDTSYYRVTGLVQVPADPIGAAGGAGGGAGPVAQAVGGPAGGVPTILVPGNKIFVELTCQNCDIYTSDGEGGYVEQGAAYELETGRNGTFSISLLLRSPLDLGVDSYKQTLDASIGVETATFALTVNNS